MVRPGKEGKKCNRDKDLNVETGLLEANAFHAGSRDGIVAGRRREHYGGKKA